MYVACRFGGDTAKWISINRWEKGVKSNWRHTKWKHSVSESEIDWFVVKEIRFSTRFGNVIRANRWAEEEEAAEICILLTCDGDGGRNVLDLLVLNACVKLYMYEP